MITASPIVARKRSMLEEVIEEFESKERVYYAINVYLNLNLSNRAMALFIDYNSKNLRFEREDLNLLAEIVEEMFREQREQIVDLQREYNILNDHDYEYHDEEDANNGDNKLLDLEIKNLEAHFKKKLEEVYSQVNCFLTYCEVSIRPDLEEILKRLKLEDNKLL